MRPGAPGSSPTASAQLLYLAAVAVGGCRPALTDGAPPVPIRQRSLRVIEGACASIRSPLARTGCWLVCCLIVSLGPIGAAAQQTALPEEAVPASEWMERQVHRVERTLQGAQFRSALGISAQLRNHRAATDRQKIRLELAHATAAIALGETDASEESLQRILQLDPDFSLTAEDSPKLHRALQNLREVQP